MMNGILSHSSELHILEHKLRVSNLKKDAISLYTHALIKISLLPRSKYVWGVLWLYYFFVSLFLFSALQWKKFELNTFVLQETCNILDYNIH